MCVMMFTADPNLRKQSLERRLGRSSGFSEDGKVNRYGRTRAFGVRRPFWVAHTWLPSHILRKKKGQLSWQKRPFSPGSDKEKSSTRGSSCGSRSAWTQNGTQRAARRQQTETVVVVPYQFYHQIYYLLLLIKNKAPVWLGDLGNS